MITHNFYSKTSGQIFRKKNQQRRRRIFVNGGGSIN
jgi:hypothetical protein